MVAPLMLAEPPTVSVVTLSTAPFSTAALVMSSEFEFPVTAAKVVVPVALRLMAAPRVAVPSISMVLPAVMPAFRLTAPDASWSNAPAAVMAPSMVSVPVLETMMFPLPVVVTVLSKSTVPPASISSVPLIPTVLLKPTFRPSMVSESSGCDAPTVSVKATSPFAPALTVSDSAPVAEVASTVPRKSMFAPPPLLVSRVTAASMMTLSLSVTISLAVVMPALRVIVEFASRVTLASPVPVIVPSTSICPPEVCRATGSAKETVPISRFPVLLSRPMVMLLKPSESSAASVSLRLKSPVALLPTPMVRLVVSGCSTRSPEEPIVPLARVSVSAVMVMSPLVDEMFSPAALVISAAPAPWSSMETSPLPLAEMKPSRARSPAVITRSMLPLPPVVWTSPLPMVRPLVSSMKMPAELATASRVSTSVVSDEACVPMPVALRLSVAPVTVPPPSIMAPAAVAVIESLAAVTVLRVMLPLVLVVSVMSPFVPATTSLAVILALVAVAEISPLVASISESVTSSLAMMPTLPEVEA